MKNQTNPPVKEKYPDGRNKTMVLYHGYQIFRNGDVYAPNGRKIPIGTNRDLSRYVILSINSVKKRKINIARLIYSIFSGQKLTMKEMVRFKDDNPDHLQFENLYVIHRKEYYKKNNISVVSSSKMMDEQTVEKIKKEYGTNRSKGHINQWNKKDISMRDLAQKYKCSLYTIQRIVHDKY